jgi:two-component system invasion response regulator UvrY
MEHKVALVDDHHLMRSGLAATVNGLGGYQVCLEAGNGLELVEALQLMRNNALPLPAIAIVDLNMPVMDGYETMAWLREQAPEVLVLALTFDGNEQAVVRAIRAGARGFLLKNTRPAVLKTALDSLLLTGYYYTENTHEALRSEAVQRTREERDRADVLARITPREMEFLLLVCDEAEYTYEQMAERLGIHRRSVDNYRISLFEKFDIKSKTGLVLFAMRWGLIGPAA